MTAGRVPTLGGRLCSLRKLVPADATIFTRNAAWPRVAAKAGAVIDVALYAAYRRPVGRR